MPFSCTFLLIAPIIRQNKGRENVVVIGGGGGEEILEGKKGEMNVWEKGEMKAAEGMGWAGCGTQCYSKKGLGRAKSCMNAHLNNYIMITNYATKVIEYDRILSLTNDKFVVLNISNLKLST